MDTVLLFEKHLFEKHHGGQGYLLSDVSDLQSHNLDSVDLAILIQGFWNFTVGLLQHTLHRDVLKDNPETIRDP